MSEGFATILVLYILFSLLFSLMWIDNIILNGKGFYSKFCYSIKNKNAFGKVYVTIFYLIALPSYLFAMFLLYVCLILQCIYNLGVKRDNEIKEVTE